MTPPRTNSSPAIRWRGKFLTIPEASAVAGQEHRKGNLQAVADIYALILAKIPNYPEGHNNRGAILQMLKRYDEALACYDQAIALKPDYANAHYNRGTTLKKLLRRDEALASYDRAVALNPGHVEAHNNRGVLLQELKRYDEALTCFDKVISLNPAHAEGYNNRGIVLASKGVMAEAETMFLKAAALKPDFPDPLFNLANIRSHSSVDNAEMGSILALLTRPGLSPETTEHLHFSLAKIYDDCGEYDKAFTHYQQANQLRNSQVAYDAGLVERMTKRTIEVFSGEFLSQPSSFATNSRSPLFIVGMPRSGTTLVASILSNHTAVATAGELATLGDLTLEFPALTPEKLPYPEAARHMSEAAAKHVIAQYEKRLRRDVGPETAHVIDKNPLNFRHVGLITLLFPNARIIHCTRHPLATCLSNYFQRFPLHLDYCFDLANIGHFYKEYALHMEHWRKIPTVRMHEVSYEDIILNTRETVSRLLNFLEIPWDDRCLMPHTNAYAVETASQWQVRQPIYQRSLDNWRHYEKHLAPLKEVLLSAELIPAGETGI